MRWLALEGACKEAKETCWATVGAVTGYACRALQHVPMLAIRDVALVDGVAFRFRQHVSRVPLARAQPTHAGKKLAGTQGDGNRNVESNPRVSDAVAVALQYYGHLRTGWQVLAKMESRTPPVNSM